MRPSENGPEQGRTEPYGDYNQSNCGARESPQLRVGTDNKPVKKLKTKAPASLKTLPRR